MQRNSVLNICKKQNNAIKYIAFASHRQSIYSVCLFAYSDFSCIWKTNFGNFFFFFDAQWNDWNIFFFFERLWIEIHFLEAKKCNATHWIALLTLDDHWMDFRQWNSHGAIDFGRFFWRFDRFFLFCRQEF